MTADHERLLASIERRALDAGVPRDELEAQVADELRVPLDHYAAYLLVRGALDSYTRAHHPTAAPGADSDVPSDRPEARQLRRLWEHVGAIHEAAVAGGDIRVVVREHARDLIRELLHLSERVLAARDREDAR